jgi:hypothetical protein
MGCEDRGRSHAMSSWRQSYLWSWMNAEPFILARYLDHLSTTYPNGLSGADLHKIATDADEEAQRLLAAADEPGIEETWPIVTVDRDDWSGINTTWRIDTPEGGEWLGED